MKKFNRLSRALQIIRQFFYQLFIFLYCGFRSGRGLSSVTAFLRFFIIHLNRMGNSLRELNEIGQLEGGAIERLKKSTLGLHSLLPKDGRFSYSILIPVYMPKPDYFKKALIAALNQTAPDLEVLVGFDGPQPPEVYEVVEALQDEYGEKLKSFQVDRTVTGGGISATTNHIASLAKGNFLLLMDHDDWIRPDLLFRYEQTLRLFSDPENRVLYCDEYKIDENDQYIPGSELKKPEQPPFPYIFVNFVCHCLLVPHHLWKKVGGCRSQCNNAQDYDLILRLDLAGAQFQNVPFLLYAWRVHSQSTAKNIHQKSDATEAGLVGLRNYVKEKDLNWEVEQGFLPTTYRAKPILAKIPNIQVIIPFKEQKQLTLATVHSIRKQKGVNVKITAVDNNSQDTSIGEEVRALGGEVLVVKEPFNYSRLNNLAVKNSVSAQDCELILFLNNDVELEEDALLEMCRWIDQPHIGMVGCRLHYPNGLLQHGGVDLQFDLPAHSMAWHHTGKFETFDGMGFTRVLRVTDAVTAACALMRRDVFVKIKGFDEVWYPIAYSDTNLAIKLKAKGLWCFYTPYASGTHHESITRLKDNIEDFERSRWLHEKYFAVRPYEVNDST